jgi:uncharacterized protein
MITNPFKPMLSDHGLSAKAIDGYQVWNLELAEWIKDNPFSGESKYWASIVDYGLLSLHFKCKRIEPGRIPAFPDGVVWVCTGVHDKIIAMLPWEFNKLTTFSIIATIAPNAIVKDGFSITHEHETTAERVDMELQKVERAPEPPILVLEDLIPLSPWVEPSIFIMREHMKTDGSHDEGHLVRVAKMAMAFTSSVGDADLDVLLPAVILHDLFNAPKDNPDLRKQSSRISADMAVSFIMQLLPFKNAKHEIGVFHAIEAHSWSAEVIPVSIEAKALQDADRIEALGMIGIARMFSVGGSLSRKIFHPTDPLALSRIPDEFISAKPCRPHLDGVWRRVGRIK